MSFLAGEVTVRCPVCAQRVTMQVHVSSVACWGPNSHGVTSLAAVLDDARSERHPCVPAGDGRAPIERFVETGALDDDTFRPVKWGLQ